MELVDHMIALFLIFCGTSEKMKLPEAEGKNTRKTWEEEFSELTQDGNSSCFHQLEHQNPKYTENWTEYSEWCYLSSGARLVLGQGPQTFPIKVHIVNILDFIDRGKTKYILYILT